MPLRRGPNTATAAPKSAGKPGSREAHAARQAGCLATGRQAERAGTVGPLAALRTRVLEVVEDGCGARGRWGTCRMVQAPSSTGTAQVGHSRQTIIAESNARGILHVPSPCNQVNGGLAWCSAPQAGDREPKQRCAAVTGCPTRRCFAHCGCRRAPGIQIRLPAAYQGSDTSCAAPGPRPWAGRCRAEVYSQKGAVSAPLRAPAQPDWHVPAAGGSQSPPAPGSCRGQPRTRPRLDTPPAV